jgi:hypothetical protein
MSRLEIIKEIVICHSFRECKNSKTPEVFDSQRLQRKGKLVEDEVEKGQVSSTLIGHALGKFHLQSPIPARHVKEQRMTCWICVLTKLQQHHCGW